MSGAPRRALLISENAPVPGDRRVWNQSRALVEAGWSVGVVCAAAEDRDEPAVETIDGVEINRYPLRPAAGGVDYGREYAQALARIRTLVRAQVATARPDIVHSANPPDFLREGVAKRVPAQLKPRA